MKTGSMMKILQRMTDQMKAEQYDEVRIKKLTSVMNFFRKIGRRTLDFLKVEMSGFSLEDLLDKARQTLMLEGLSPEEIHLYVRTQEKMLISDINYVERLIVNAVLYLSQRYLSLIHI